MNEPPHDPPPRAAEVIPLRSPGQPPASIAVASGKGGVGRTQIAVGLACRLAQVGHRVLCVDGDVALGGADLLLGVAPTHSAADVLEGAVEAEQALVRSRFGVSLLAASGGRPDLAPLGESRCHALLHHIERLEPRFDTAILDLPAGIGPDALALATACTLPLLVVTPEPASVESACSFLAAVAARGAARRVRVVANRVASTEEGEDLFRRVVRQADRRPHVAARLSLDLVGALPVDDALPRASMRGVPFALAEPDRPGARALARLAEAVSHEATDPAPCDGGLRLLWQRPPRPRLLRGAPSPEEPCDVRRP